MADPDGAPVTVETRCLVDLLPAEATEGLHVLEGVDHTQEITLEHLLRHTAGLPDYDTKALRGGRSPEAPLRDGEDVPVPFDEVLRLVHEELAPHFPSLPREASKCCGPPRRPTRARDRQSTGSARRHRSPPLPLTLINAVDRGDVTLASPCVPRAWQEASNRLRAGRLPCHRPASIGLNGSVLLMTVDACSACPAGLRRASRAGNG